MSGTHQVFLLLHQSNQENSRGLIRAGASDGDSARQEEGESSALRGWAPAGER